MKRGIDEIREKNKVHIKWRITVKAIKANRRDDMHFNIKKCFLLFLLITFICYYMRRGKNLKIFFLLRPPT